jgi:hypothetical protein
MNLFVYLYKMHERRRLCRTVHVVQTLLMVGCGWGSSWLARTAGTAAPHLHFPPYRAAYDPLQHMA